MDKKIKAFTKELEKIMSMGVDIVADATTQEWKDYSKELGEIEFLVRQCEKFCIALNPEEWEEP